MRKVGTLWLRAVPQGVREAANESSAGLEQALISSQ